MPFIFNNPFLPTTRSEMALPLKTSNEIIGVLDIQSDQPQAFAQEDIDILQVMADQLAIAIERIQLLEQVQNQFKRNRTDLSGIHKAILAGFCSQRKSNCRL